MTRMNSAVIIIGAGRSGTNMLRDVLTRLPGWATWPCDEINYIWRHGNVHYPSDEFTVDMARTEVCQYIRRKFDWVARHYTADVVVEKTCANSLRVQFVNRVVPEARYIFIRRDGYDAIASAMHRWKAKMEIGYLARKARFVPVTDFPYYASRYLLNRFNRFITSEKRLAFWGPKLNNMQDFLANYTLVEVCALQWKRCVESASKDLSALSADRWVEVNYENFVCNPRSELERILNTLGFLPNATDMDWAVHGISQASVGKGRRELGDAAITKLRPFIGDTLEKYGYV